MGWTDTLRHFFVPWEQRVLTPQQAWAADIEWTGNSDAGVPVNQRNATALATVYACTTLIADITSTLPVDVYFKRDGFPVPWRPRFAWLDTPLPNDPSVTRATHFAQVALSLLFDGNAFVHVSPAVQAAADRDAKVALTVLDPRRVTIKTDTSGRPSYLLGTRTYTSDEVLHIPRTMRPGQTRGMSPIDEAAQTLGVAMAAQKHSARFYRNGALMSTIVKVPGEMSEEDALQLREAFQGAHSGDNVFKVGVLTGGAEAVTLGVTPEQAQFLETIRFHVVEVCRLFRVPPMLVGVNEPGAVSYASSQEAVKAFHVNTLAPLLSVIQQGYSRLTPPGTYLAFDTKGLLRADPEQRYQAYAVGLEKGFVSRNEVRGWEELPPIKGDGGDLFTVQAQMVDLEQIANPPEPPPAPEGGGSAPPFEGEGRAEQRHPGHSPQSVHAGKGGGAAGMVTGADADIWADKSYSLRRNMKILGTNVTVEDLDHPQVQKHLRDLGNVPPGVLRTFVNGGGTMEITSAPASKLGLKGTPRGWSATSSWDDVPGVYDTLNNHVFVGNTSSHGSESLLMHELGHGMDFYANVSASDSDWRSAWASSVKANSGIHSRHPYFSQSGNAGAQEMFAEAFAVYHRWDRRMTVTQFGEGVAAQMDKWSEVWAILDNVE